MNYFYLRAHSYVAEFLSRLYTGLPVGFHR